MDQERSTFWRNAETVTHGARSAGETSERLLPGLTILGHPDVRRIGETSVLSALGSGHDALLSRLEPVFTAPSGTRGRPLADPHVSRHPIRLAPRPAGAVRLIAAGTKTRLSADGTRITESLDVTRGDLERGVVLMLAERIVLLLHLLDPAPHELLPKYGLVGESKAMVSLRREITQVADLDVSALIRGETGTGKELVARAIHQASARSRRAFVAVNMGAVPSELAAAELFGAARGAFTGANRRRDGYFVRAQGGTLFLDEIGETPQEVQVMLLRALECQRIQPLGADKETEIDVRVVAATDADLEAEVEAGRFRGPLLHRLSGYEIELPPLRDRRDDLGRLLLHFLRGELENVSESWRLDSYDEPWLAAPVVARLAAYSWPGNVRQLRNVARQLVIASRGASRIRVTPQVEKILKPTAERWDESVEIFDVERQGTAPEVLETPVGTEAADEADLRTPDPRYRSPSEVDEEELLRQLRAHDFRLQPAAAALGISRTSLYALIEKSDRIRKARDLTREEIERCRRRHADLDAMAADLEVSRKGLRRRMTELGFT